MRAPTNPLSGLGLRDIYWGNRLISGRGAFSAPAISKQGFRSIVPLPKIDRTPDFAGRTAIGPHCWITIAGDRSVP